MKDSENIITSLEKKNRFIFTLTFFVVIIAIYSAFCFFGGHSGEGVESLQSSIKIVKDGFLFATFLLFSLFSLLALFSTKRALKNAKNVVQWALLQEKQFDSFEDASEQRERLLNQRAWLTTIKDAKPQ